MAKLKPEVSEAVPSHLSRRFFQGKRVAITGAAGSIGSALAEHLAGLGCVQLALLDQFDHGLIDVVERVGAKEPSLDVVDVLCDVRDGERLSRKFQRLRPDVVVHAAALKHVHLGERHPGECVLANLVGTRNALIAAHAAAASHFTLISSDKAAAPVCVMGATKRLAELFMLGFARKHAPSMSIKAVRFGNVIGSQGSVFPRFVSQIAAGGPLTVTHPDMERFFMSSDDAVGLITRVTQANEPPGVYYMNMGAPISILDMGREMIARSGSNVEVKFTGLRPGEKLSEALFDACERVEPSNISDVFRLEPLSPNAVLSSEDITQLERLARVGEDAIIRQRIFALLDARLGREDSAAG